MFPGSLTGAMFIEWSSHDQAANYPGFSENIYYFGAGRRCQNLNGRRATHAHWKQVSILLHVIAPPSPSYVSELVLIFSWAMFGWRAKNLVFYCVLY